MRKHVPEVPDFGTPAWEKAAGSVSSSWSWGSSSPPLTLAGLTYAPLRQLDDEVEDAIPEQTQATAGA